MAGEDLAANAVASGEQILNDTLSQITSVVIDKFSPLITLFKVVGIVLLIYILFLILKAIISIRTSGRIKRIAKNVESINSKLDVLISNTAKKEDEKKEAPAKMGFFRRLFGRKERINASGKKKMNKK